MRRCEKCGRSIIAKNAQALYCSTKCRVSAHRAAKRPSFPAELRRHDRWVRWAPNKRPLQADGSSASSTNPETWGSYDEVAASTAGVGIGFALGEGIGCIDLDHCLISGELTPQAAKFIENYPEHYIEVSPSLHGLHILGTRTEQPGTRRNVDGLAIEVYSTGRYITVTGNVYQPGRLLPIPDSL